MTERPSVANYNAGSFKGSHFGSGIVLNVNTEYTKAAFSEPSWEDVFAWLTRGRTDLNFASLQEDMRTKRLPDTGKWFTESRLFKSWQRPDIIQVKEEPQNNSLDTSSVARSLLCYGPRGCGKTMLLSFAVTTLQEQIETNKLNQAVFYAYLSNENEISCRDYVSALIGQLLQQRRRVSILLQTAFVRHKPLNSYPSISELLEIFSAEIASFDHIYVLLDALDEASKQTRGDLMTAVRNLMAKHSSIKLLATSYDEVLLRSYKEDLLRSGTSLAKCVNLSSQQKDLLPFIKANVQSMEVIKALRLDSSKEDHLIEMLLERASGLILLADQHLQQIEIANPQTIADLFDEANDLSSTIDQVYSDKVQRILKQTGSAKFNAQIALFWIACAGTELPINLIKHAIAFAKNTDPVLDESHLPSERHITSVCQGLVKTRKNGKFVSFSHPTIFIFFENNMNQIGIDDAETLIPQVCLRQLRYSDRLLSGENHPSSSLFELHYANYPLLSYALNDLCVHLGDNVPPSILFALNELTADRETTSRLGTLMLSRYWRVEFGSIEEWSNASDTHLFVILGLSFMLRSADRPCSDIDAQDVRGWSPLRWAVVAENQRMVSILADLGCRVALRDKSGLSTLRWALGADEHFSIEFGSIHGMDRANIVLGHRIVLTPYTARCLELGLAHKSTYTNTCILELLVERSNPDWIRLNGDGLLRTACQKRLKGVVKRLLALDVTPGFLVEALVGFSYCVEVNDCLLEDSTESVIGCIVKVNEWEWRSDRTVSYKMTLDDRWMCRLITSETMKTQGPRNRSVLSLAAEMGFAHVVQALIRQGADVNQVDFDGWTPLMWAVVRPKPFKFFLRNCALKDAATTLVGIGMDINGRFSEDLHKYQDLDSDSLEQRKGQIVTSLLEAGAKWWHKDKDGVSTLQKAQWDRIPGIISRIEKHVKEDAYHYPPSPDFDPWEEDVGSNVKFGGRNVTCCQSFDPLGWPTVFKSTPSFELLRFLLTPSLESASVFWALEIHYNPFASLSALSKPFCLLDSWNRPFAHSSQRSRPQPEGITSIHALRPKSWVAVTNLHACDSSRIYSTGQTRRHTIEDRVFMVLNGGLHGEMEMRGQARLLSTGDWGMCYISDNALKWEVDEMEYELPYMPPQISQSIFSMIQLRIDNVTVRDEARVFHGLLSTEHETPSSPSGLCFFIDFSKAVGLNLLDIFKRWAMPNCLKSREGFSTFWDRRMLCNEAFQNALENNYQDSLGDI